MGDVKTIANRTTNNMSISSRIVIAGLVDNKTMTKNQRKKNMADTSKTEGTNREHIL